MLLQTFFARPPLQRFFEVGRGSPAQQTRGAGALTALDPAVDRLLKASERREAEVAQAASCVADEVPLSESSPWLRKTQ